MRNSAYFAELFMRGILAGVPLGTALGYVYGDGFLSLFTGLGICLLAVLVFALVRRITSRFSLFFICHIIFTLAVITFVPTFAAKFMCGIILAVLTGDSVAQLKKSFDDGNRLHFGMSVIFILTSYIAGYNNMPVLEQACFVMTAIFIALYFIRIGFYNTQQFIKHNDNGRGAPLKDIKIRSYSLVAAFALCVGVFMIAVRYMGGETIIASIGNALYALFAAVARWLIYQLQGEYVANPDTAEDTDMFGFVKDAFEERSVPAFIEVLEKIVRYLFTAAIIIGVIALVIWLVFKLYSIFGKKQNSRTSTISEFISPVKTDKTSLHRNVKQKRAPMSNKARRYYKKYVMQHLASKDLSPAHTPFEISRQLGIDTFDNDSEIRRIYEKARYSEEDCTKEELKALKEYVKGTK